MEIYDIAIVGGGPAGCMAAITAARLQKSVVLLEKNDVICKKVLMTGKGRCNITNSAPVETFVEKFGRQGKFLRTAFYNFSNDDLIDFFKSSGLELKAERQGRIFPATDKASSVVETLKKCLTDSGAHIVYNSRLAGLNYGKNCFVLKMSGGGVFCARRIVLSPGGSSYKATGSTGDGFEVAARFGHKIAPLKPALVPLKTGEAFVKYLQGLALKNVRIKFGAGKKALVSPIGELMFTHFGVSGPLVLDLSGEVIPLLDDFADVPLLIDLKPGLDRSLLEKRLLKEFRENCNIDIGNLMKEFLPRRLVPAFLQLAGLAAGKKANQVSSAERKAIIDTLKGFPLTINGSLPIEEGMVTNGGVSTAEINPRTMESKLVQGLFFAGEIIDGCASSGGYNLQQAFSTGCLAGMNAAKSG